MVFLWQQLSGEGNVLHSSLFDTTDAVFVLLYSDCHCHSVQHGSDSYFTDRPLWSSSLCGVLRLLCSVMFENDRGSLSSPLIGLKTAQTEDQLTTLPTRQSQTSDFVPGAAPGESC